MGFPWQLTRGILTHSSIDDEIKAGLTRCVTMALVKSQNLDLIVKCLLNNDISLCQSPTRPTNLSNSSNWWFEIHHKRIRMWRHEMTRNQRQVARTSTWAEFRGRIRQSLYLVLFHPLCWHMLWTFIVYSKHNTNPFCSLVRVRPIWQPNPWHFPLTLLYNVRNAVTKVMYK